MIQNLAQESRASRQGSKKSTPGPLAREPKVLLSVVSKPHPSLAHLRSRTQARGGPPTSSALRLCVGMMTSGSE